MLILSRAMCRTAYLVRLPCAREQVCRAFLLESSTVFYRGVYFGGHSAGAHLAVRALDSSLKNMLSAVSEDAASMIKGRRPAKSY